MVYDVAVGGTRISMAEAEPTNRERERERESGGVRTKSTLGEGSSRLK
jgi:hypothetical protein